MEVLTDPPPVPGVLLRSERGRSWSLNPAPAGEIAILARRITV
jgi:hypothetical protein